MGKLIQLPEAARRLGLSDQTLRNWVAKGALTVKKVGKAHYVDEDTVNALSDTFEDVERSRLALEKLRGELDQERHDRWAEHRDEHLQRRYLNLCVEGSIRSVFFHVVVSLMVTYGSLNEREGAILQARLMGETLDSIGDEFGLTRERVRQITEKAIRKSRDITEISRRLSEVDALKADNEALRQTVLQLKKALKRREDEERQEAERNEEERLQAFIKNDKICKLLSSKLVDYPLSVRVLNCLKSGDVRENYDPQTRQWYRHTYVAPCETIGDLCRMNKTDFLKLRNAGKKSLNELDEFLERLGLSFGMDVDKIYKERVDAMMKQEKTETENEAGQE